MKDKLISANKLKQHYAWWGNVDNEVYQQMKVIFDTIVDIQPEVKVKAEENERG